MANSFAVLWSYIDNALWFCTKAFHLVFFVFEFNYRLVTALFRGCIQLWTLTTQGIRGVGHGIVTVIEFLGNLPFETYSFVCYLIELCVDSVQRAFQLSVAWFVAKLMWSIQAVATGMWNVVTYFTDLWARFLDSLVLGFAHYVHLSEELLESAVKYISDVRSNTGLVLYNAKVSFWGSLLDIASAVIEYTVAIVTYPLVFVTDIVYSLLEFSEVVINNCVQYAQAGCTSIADVFYDAIHTLDQIASFPMKVFYRAADNVEELVYHTYELYTSVTDGINESLSCILEFAAKNLYAIIALSLCFSLLAAVTIYLNVQHDRNVQTALQNLTRLITSFTQSQAQREREQEARQEVEGHLQNDLPPEGQAPLEAGDENIQDDGAINHHPVHGQGDQPGPSKVRGGHRTGYSLRSRPFTPTEEMASGSDSVEGLVKDLKHRLDEEYDKQLCVICQDAAKNTLFLPCRHLCVCLDCAETLIGNPIMIQRQCPLCRTRIGSIVEVYS